MKIKLKKTIIVVPWNEHGDHMAVEKYIYNPAGYPYMGAFKCDKCTGFAEQHGLLQTRFGELRICPGTFIAELPGRLNYIPLTKTSLSLMGYRANKDENTKRN